MLRPWLALTESRRGWAIGGMFGLMYSAIYFAIVDHVHAQFAFQLATIPCLPGNLISENAVLVIWTPTTRNQMIMVRFAIMATGCAINYAFWGSYFSFLYRMNPKDYAPHHTTEALANFIFSLLLMFLSFFGIAYAYGRGVSLQEFSTPLLVLVGSFLLGLIGLASLYFFLVAFFDDSSR